MSRVPHKLGLDAVPGLSTASAGQQRVRERDQLWATTTILPESASSARHILFLDWCSVCQKLFCQARSHSVNVNLNNQR